MSKIRCIVYGIAYEAAFLAALTAVWRTESMFAAIAIAVLTGFLLSRCVTRTPAFRPVKDSLLWLGAALAAHLLADRLRLPLYIVRLCDAGVRENGPFSPAEGLLVGTVMAVFAVGSLGVYAVSLGAAACQRRK